MTVKFLICISIVLGIDNAICAQVPILQWQRSIGGTNDDKAATIIVTNNGNYVIGGSIASYDGDINCFNGSTDIWLIGLDSTGSNIIWQKCLGGTLSDRCESIEETADGGYIICGRTSSNNGDVSGLHCPNPPCPFGGIPDIWVVKTDSVGNIQHQRCLGGTDDEFGWQVHQGYDGSFILIGTTYSNDSDVTGNHWPIVGASDFWLVNLDSSLNIQWQKCYGGSGLEDGYSVQQTSDSGYILCGSTYYSNDGDVNGNHGLTDVWVVKVNQVGLIQWQKCYGGSDEDLGSYIVTSNDGGYVFCGSTHSNDNEVSGNHGGNDFWVVKIDSTGVIDNFVTQ